MKILISNPLAGLKKTLQKVKVAILSVCVLFLMAVGCGFHADESSDENSSEYEEQVFMDKKTDFYYNDKGEKEFFNIRKDKLILKCKSETQAKALIKDFFFLTAYDMGVWVIATINPSIIKLHDVLQRPEVLTGTYGLEEAGDFYYPTDRIAVKLKDGYTLEEVLDATGITENVVTTELFDSYSEVYLIYLNVELGDILRVSRMLYETGSCIIAAPSMTWEINR